MLSRPAGFLLRAALSLSGLAIGVSFAFAASPGRPAHLTSDAMVQPLGIDSAQPLLSWQLQDDSFGARQTAYRIEVATKPALLEKPDVWDSGRVASDKSVGVAYAGPSLSPETRYYWRVQLWDKDGKPYPMSEATWWETGLLKETWKAQWIGYEEPEQRAVHESGAQWITNADSGVPRRATPSTTSDSGFRLPAR